MTQTGKRVAAQIHEHRRGILFTLIAILAAAPGWIVAKPPLVDLPYHAATIRILHSWSDPAMGMAEHYQIAWSQTQFSGYYLLGSLVSYVVGVANANVVLMIAYFAGTMLALRCLLRARGADERLCLFVIPILTNALFMRGLLPFLLGIPLALWALAFAIRHFRSPSVKDGIGLWATSLLSVFIHPIPFFVIALGAVFLFPFRSPKVWARAAIPLVPSAFLGVGWLRSPRSRFDAVGALAESGQRPIGKSLGELNKWFLDIFRDDTDESTLTAWLVLMTLTLLLGRKLALRMALLPLSCAILYFYLPDGHGFVWPLSQRFALLAALLIIPAMSMPKRGIGVALTGGMLGVGIYATANVTSRFASFQRTEIRALDTALAGMEPGRKVCALIYARFSSFTRTPVFLHFGSYYQLHKGGLVQFSFVGYPHWPVQYRPGKFPPPGTPARSRWEWTPHEIRMQEIHPYYDYVLTRGPGFSAPGGEYRVQNSSGAWKVWKRN